MNRWQIGILSAILLISQSTRVSAQAPGMTAWWDRPVARDLGLSDEQKKQIRETVRESRDRLFQLRGSVQAAEADLRDEMNAEKVDSARAAAVIDRVVAARGELMKAVSRMSLQLRMILTAEQWQELQKREGIGALGRSGLGGRLTGPGKGRGGFKPPE
jgi:Spy/CpxP family protein refolding chaperone